MLAMLVPLYFSDYLNYNSVIIKFMYYHAVTRKPYYTELIIYRHSLRLS
jgi:hypothetical protein